MSRNIKENIFIILSMFIWLFIEDSELLFLVLMFELRIFNLCFHLLLDWEDFKIIGVIFDPVRVSDSPLAGKSHTHKLIGTILWVSLLKNILLLSAYSDNKVVNDFLYHNTQHNPKSNYGVVIWGNEHIQKLWYELNDWWPCLRILLLMNKLPNLKNTTVRMQI